MPELVHSHLNFPDEPDKDDGRDGAGGNAPRREPEEDDRYRR